MKEKILQKIKEKLGTTQLSDRTINEVAVNFLSLTITSDEQLTDEAIASEVARLKVMEGQLNHDVAEIARKNKPIDPVKAEPNKVEPQKFELPKEILEELEESRKFRQEYLKQQDETKKQVQRTKLFDDVKKALSSEGCTDEIMLRLSMPSIDYEKSVEENVKNLKDVYNGELSNYTKKQGYTPSSQSAQTPTMKTQEEIAKEQRARAEEIKNKGLIN